jgi:hypothetical protein
MPLKSYLFQGSDRLNACLVNDAKHVTLGQSGEHVADIQIALQHIDGLNINATELLSKTYGPSTAAAVLAYKKKRKIINSSYQSTADNIVGKMTIAALDDDMVARQRRPAAATRRVCSKGTCFCEPDRPGETPPKTVPQHVLMAWAADGITSKPRG